MLKSELITEKNLEEALRLQNLIFPRENARANYLDSINEHKNSKLPPKYRVLFS